MPIDPLFTRYILQHRPEYVSTATIQHSYFKSDGYNPLTVTDTIKLAKICADDYTQPNLFSFSH